MELLKKLFLGVTIKKTARKTLAQYKEELVFKQGAEQLKKLIRSGIGVPIKVL